MSWRHLLGLLCFTLLFGCSSGSGPNATALDGSAGGSAQDAGVGSKPDASAPSPDGVALTIVSVKLTRQFSNLTAGDNAYFAVLGTQVGNSAGKLPLMISPMLFSVSTDAGLIVSPSPAAIALSDCPNGAQLEANHSVACNVIFEIALTARPLKVSYKSPDGRAASANIPAQNCTFCGDDCVDLKSDPAHCGACNQPVPSGGDCDSGTQTCPSPLQACGTSCVDITSDPKHCGACSSALGDNEICSGGKKICEAGYTRCGSSCVDTKYDYDNCGSCGHACQGSCTNGTCTVTKKQDVSQLGSVSKPCSVACAPKACVEANVTYWIPYPPGSCPYPLGSFVSLGCDETPKYAEDCFAYNIYCECVE